MKTLHFTQNIEAPKERVWDTMFNAKTYPEWTSAFTEDSHFKGSWDKGSEIRFLDSDGNGMLSTIAENRLHEFISIKHIGIIQDGKEDTESDEAAKWTPAFENYTFTDEDGKTTVTVDMDIDKEYEDMFKEMWPEALKKLKELSENE